MGKPPRERQRLAVWGMRVEEGPGGGETGTEEGPAPLLVLRGLSDSPHDHYWVQTAVQALQTPGF